MASDDAGLSRVSFMIIPNTKRHPSNMKTDQLPISEVITGLPRPYHHISRRLGYLSWLGLDAVSWLTLSRRPVTSC